MGNGAVPINEGTYLTACFRGEFGKVFCEFGGNYLVMYPSPVNSLDRVKVAGLET
jgi:hypothetical protein